MPKKRTKKNVKENEENKITPTTITYKMLFPNNQHIRGERRKKCNRSKEKQTENFVVTLCFIGKQMKNNGKTHENKLHSVNAVD